MEGCHGESRDAWNNVIKVERQKNSW